MILYLPTFKIHLFRKSLESFPENIIMFFQKEFDVSKKASPCFQKNIGMLADPYHEFLFGNRIFYRFAKQRGRRSPYDPYPNGLPDTVVFLIENYYLILTRPPEQLLP